MSNNSSSLIKIVTPKRWAGLSMDFIEPGYIALLVKNGRCVKQYAPGRHINFAMPWLTKCQLYLVNSKELSSKIVSTGDFSSSDGYLINISLNIRYRVIDAVRIALEIDDPVTELQNAVKDALGIAVQKLTVQKLTRENLKEYLMIEKDNISYPLGFHMEEIRVDSVDFPDTKGIIRKQEMMSYSEQEDQKAIRQMNIANAGQQEYQAPPPIQIVNNNSPLNPQNQSPNLPPQNQPQNRSPNLPPQNPQENRSPSLPPQNLRTPLPTQIVDQVPLINSPRLIDCSNQKEFILSGTSFSLGRGDNHNIVIPESNLSASRNHAQINTYHDSDGITRYKITDSSTNGTFVNGMKIVRDQPHLLHQGSIIQIGNQQWKFECN